MRIRRRIPILEWGSAYERRDLRADVAAGSTIAAMLVPQAMAYALLAGLPPEVGLYAATVPVVVYAFLGTSRQLAVGPVAIVSLLTASALAPLVEEGSAGYLAAAALLALMVGVVHLVLGAARLGALVNLLSHSVLVGFTAAAAIIIGFSQAKHLLGISVARQDHLADQVLEVGRNLGDTHGPTVALGTVALASLLALKRLAPRLPAALVVVVGSILAVEALDLEERGVGVVGEIPDSLPAFGLPDASGSLIGDLLVTALVITLVGFMESIAVAKVYARRHRYQVDANQELIGLGAANVASGLFGGYPVTGGFSRTAVNDAAGARTPLASIVTAVLVLATIAFFTPLLSTLPNAALGAIIITAVIGLIDVAEMRHIARVKRSDLIGLGVAFVATLALGIELGIGVAVVTSMLVVFARMSMPHTAVLGHVEGTTSYRNLERFPEARTDDGIDVVRVDAAVSFVNAATVRRLLLARAGRLTGARRALVLDASGVNDIDVTGVEMLVELLPELDERRVALHLADVKGPVRDVLRRAGLWETFADRVHASTHDAVAAILADRPAPPDQRRHGIDERTAPSSATVEPADDAWAELLAGHRRRGSREGIGPAEHRPRVAVLACSDARVPPSVLFDQPRGDLFVVRVAGNTDGPAERASLAYAVDDLGVELLVVLGHTSCGAVAAARRGHGDGDRAVVTSPICSVVARHPEASADEISGLSVGATLGRLATDGGVIGEAVRSGTLALVGAVHDLSTGYLVEVPVPSPDQPIPQETA